LDPNAIVEAYDLRKQFGLAPNYEVPSLTLVRSDGTTLYSTRDIAYSLVKFKDSDRVINVIASEQTLPQLQIRLALYALGEKEAALNMIHYAYGLVELPGVKMSKRRAHFITLDEVVEQAKVRVDRTLAERKQEIGSAESQDIIRDIAYGAIKFAMLGVNSAKNLMFTWDRVLSLERNSAPFINYAYTRAGSILRKLGKTPNNPDCSLLTHPLEHLLLFKIGELPDVFCEAADQLKPEELATYASAIAEKFHEYYEKVDVIHADEQVKNARAALVASVQVVLRNSMELLGIKLSERM
jgi:arginyl-tRNA synthetase